MKVFFDTEFTGLHQDTTLISIGLVDENNRTFYAEFVDYDKKQVDEWIKTNVINNLNCNKMDLSKKVFSDFYIIGRTEDIKEALENWLKLYDEVELVSDCCHYDMVLFANLFGGALNIPENISPCCYDINQLIAEIYHISIKDSFNLSREKFLNETISGNKHNSLYDAKVIKSLYYQLKEISKNINIMEDYNGK